MDATQSVGFAVAFAAGLLSFLSPCVLPLIPSYVSFITGLELDDVHRQRHTALVHSALFVLGFTLVFLALGATATLVGQLFIRQREWVSRVGGVLVIAFGLYLLGVFQIGALGRDSRVHIARKPMGYLGTVLVGMAFAAGWSPCIGPILGAVLTYTASAPDLQRGIVLLLAYALGLAIPFVVAALMIDRFIPAFQRFRRGMAIVTRVSGALLIVVGILMITGSMTLLTAWLQRWTPAALWNRL
ncbi:MAG TPA: cytochrome c biogenesis protein CcdA [Gemmatimonadaceae bacterium]|nr:cytochrome c biogenesis protein CcdA [Gemmatimonadaceae bacterium]